MYIFRNLHCRLDFTQKMGTRKLIDLAKGASYIKMICMTSRNSRVLFFSGHGCAVPIGDLYSPPSEALSIRFQFKVLRNVPARKNDKEMRSKKPSE